MNTVLPVRAESLLARRLVFDPPLSDAGLEELCRENDVMQFERTREGVILMNPPTGLMTGDANASISRQLGNWWVRHRRGRVYDSSTGFYLADGSMFSPDAAYVSAKALRRLRQDEMQGFGRLCPDFVIELLSASDRLAASQEKMELWIANGAQLAWLVDPYGRRVFVYAPGVSVRAITARKVPGSGPVEGFVLDTAEVWRAYSV